jgi:hypothetical protein
MCGPHQHRVLAGLVQVGQLLGDIGRIGDRLAADVEDDVAALNAVIRRRAVGVDRGDAGADRLARSIGDLQEIVRAVRAKDTAGPVSLTSAASHNATKM